MSLRLLPLICALAILSGWLLLASSISGSAEPPYSPRAPRPTQDRGNGADFAISVIPGAEPAEPSPPKNPKLSSHISRLVQADEAARGRGAEITALDDSSLPRDLRDMLDARLLRIDANGRVQAYVHTANSVEQTVGDVQTVGGQVERTDAQAGIVQAELPVRRLASLAEMPAVKFIGLPDYGFSGAGSVTTEGDAILRAADARSTYGLTGAGVRVGVISDGVGGLASSQASGNLPAVDTTTCNISGTAPTSTGAEATAMLEIVHDLAPGAALFFGHFETSLEFMAAIACLDAHTDVSVDDISFFNVGPYDGTSAISANTSSQLNNNSNPVRSYITNAGNAANQHYAGQYVPCGASTAHKFQANSETDDLGSLGTRCDNPVIVGGHSALLAYLQWDDPWGGSCNDYDLYLLVHDSNTQLASSIGPQTCSQSPTENLVWINPLGAPVVVDLVIDNSLGAAAPRNLELFTVPYGGAPLNYDTPGNSTPNQADAGGGVITTGAISADDPGHDTIESFSDQGPTNDGRTKPDITAIDCVAVTGAGGFGTPFCGTSAASPHVAGIAALLLECKPSLKAGESGDNPGADRSALRSALLDHAVDLGAAGADNVYGAGRADALASATALCSGGGSTPTPTPTPSSGVNGHASNFAWYVNVDPDSDESECDQTKPVPPNDPLNVGLCVSFDLDIPDGMYAFRQKLTLDGVTLLDSETSAHLFSGSWDLGFGTPAPGGSWHLELYANGTLLGESDLVVGVGWRQGDANCSGGLDPGDISALLKRAIGQAAAAGCATYQDDVNCINGTDAVDALAVAVYLADADPLPVNGNCTPIGNPLTG